MAEPGNMIEFDNVSIVWRRTEDSMHVSKIASTRRSRSRPAKPRSSAKHDRNSATVISS